DGKVVTASNSEVRYRDWDNLQYWFRGVEKFAPWVNKIHFVTWGHLPEWLDTTNPKLNIVKHTDFIPEEYLPTFSSHTIELNLHRIEGLAEQFVYFNDDMFFTAPVKPEDFFKNGKPCDIAALDCIFFGKDSAGSFNGSDITVINSHFKKKRVLKRDWRKWYNLKNGVRSVIKTVLLYPWPWFPGLLYQHACNSFLKSTFNEVWAKEFEALDETCSHRFRKAGDLNQWVMKFWQLAEGNFEVRSEKFAYCYHVKDSNFEKLLSDIPSGRHSLLCVNDTAKTRNFEDKKARLKEVLEECFNEVSPYENKDYYTRVVEPEEVVEVDEALKCKNAQIQKFYEGIDYLTDVVNFAKNSKSGKLSKSRQLFVLSNIAKFIKVPVSPKELLSSEDAGKYFSLLKKVIELIDEDVITSLDASHYYKLFVSQLKAQAKPELFFENNNLFVGYNEVNRYSLIDTGFSISKILIEDNTLHINGVFKTLNALPENAQITVLLDGVEVPIKQYEIEEVRMYMGVKVQTKLAFEASVSLTELDVANISFALKVENKQLTFENVKFKRTAPLNNNLTKAYYANEGFVVTANKNIVTVQKASPLGKLKKEIIFLAQILKHNKNGGKKSVIVRMCLPIMKFFVRKPIIIVEGKNEGLVELFESLTKQRPEANVYLVVPERYKDDGSLKSIGKIINKETRKYKSLVLLSSLVYTDYPESKGYNPFRKRYGFYKDVMSKKNVVYLGTEKAEETE
ncbi:MAG: stealth conserved region 3 domain-containing protein, partial [Clostridia bacterium]|nr:stealth conserved region 3 domain-containing protein [Clostridia bacterium]